MTERKFPPRYKIKIGIGYRFSLQPEEFIESDSKEYLSLEEHEAIVAPLVEFVNHFCQWDSIFTDSATAEQATQFVITKARHTMKKYKELIGEDK